MLTLSIVTPDRNVLGPVKVNSVTLPGYKGEMTVLPGHARLVGILATGVVSFELDNGKKEFASISTGFVDVNNDKVVVMAETFEMAREIDVERARRAQSKAEQKLAAKDAFESDMQKWERKLQRAQIRQLATQYLLPL